MLEQVGCNLCGSNQYSIVYKTYTGDISAISLEAYTITQDQPNLPLRLVKCRKCGLVYANPRPSSMALFTNYTLMQDTLYLEEERGRRLSARLILEQLKRLRKRGRLLDIGCSAGFLLDEARKSGWDVYGVELSEWAIDYASNKLGITTIFKGTLKEAAYPSNYFDVIVLKDTIEHLTDPKETLIEARRILKFDGLICIITPDIDSLISWILKAHWWGVKQTHLYYFTRKTIRQMLQATGFVSFKIRSHARIFTLKYWAYKIKGYNKILYKICSFLLAYNNLKNKLIRINLQDQIEVYARKRRSLTYLEEIEAPQHPIQQRNMKVIVVLPAYNAELTLKKTFSDIPKDVVDEIILVDDASQDNTVQIAKSLGIKVFVHAKNKGYGATQKTCYIKAIENQADIVVMVHPDYQYDPRVIPELVAPIKEGRADAVFGSRMMKGGALEGGMPSWKRNANILLTALENVFLVRIYRSFIRDFAPTLQNY